jgi:hypothetical protein
MRRIYNRPWQDDCPANPGKISTCIQVGVRPETTLVALESTLHSPAKLVATGAELAAVGGIDMDDINADRSCLVLDEALQLPERPSMEPCAHTPACADVVTNVREILQHNSGRRTGCHRRRVVRFYDQVEEPLSMAENQLRFLRYAGSENATLMLPEPHCDRDAALEGVERDPILNKSVSPLVEMNTRLVESDCPHGLTPLDPSRRALSPVRLADRKDCVASHLAPEIRFGAQVRITESVQIYTVPTSMLDHKWDQPIAGIGIDRSQGAQSSLLFRRGTQSDRSGTKHVSMPSADRLLNSTGALPIVATCIPHHSLNTAHPSARHSSHGILYMHTGQARTHLISPSAATPQRMTGIAGFMAEVL